MMATTFSTGNKKLISKDLHVPKKTQEFLKHNCWSFSTVSSTSMPEKHGSFSESELFEASRVD